MTRKLLMVLVSVLVIAGLVLAGCAPKAAPPEEEEEAAPPAEEEEEEEEASAPEVEVIKWDVQAIWPAGFMSYVSCEDVINRINIASGGRLEITLFPSGAIVPAYDILDAVDSGALDGEVSGISAQFGNFATAMFFDKYPAGPNVLEIYTWLYHGGGLELWQELYDMNDINMHVVGPIGCSQAENFGWFPKKITSLKDFKGLKFRTQGTWGDVLTALGCSVVTMPGGEVYESAQRGVIDAFEYSTPAVDMSAGFHEIMPVMMEPGIHAPIALYDFIVNGDRWNELPDDLKVLVELGCQAGATWVLTDTDYQDIYAFKDLMDYGTEVGVLPDEVVAEIVVIANGIWDEMAAEDPFFAEVLKSQRDFLRDYRALNSLKQPDPALLTWPH
jgi:TRAP-type mannitol/chloroaromatic compound transport system substrate-binding protein